MSEHAQVLFVEGHRLQGVARLSGLLRRLYMQRLHVGFTKIAEFGRGLRVTDDSSSPINGPEGPSPNAERIDTENKLQQAVQRQEELAAEAAALRASLAQVSQKLRQVIRDKGKAERALIAAGVQ